MKKTLFTVSALALAAACILLADGGTLVLHRQAGPLDISLFSSPEPLRTGPADLSVMIQKTDDRSTVLDASVKIHLTQAGTGDISEVFAPATHANATNKLLYAAKLNLPSPGRWRVAVFLESKSGSAEVAGGITVLPPRPPLFAYWPYFAVVPALALLFVINRWLNKRRVRNRRVPT